MDSMVAEMSWSEMVSWRAFYDIEPFGEQRADLRIAYAIARLATYLGGGKEKINVSDFMVQDAIENKPPKPKPTYDEVRSSVFGALGLATPPRVNKEPE